MPRFACVLAPVLFLCIASFSAHAEDTVQVRMTTNVGAVLIELEAERAPITVANFLKYVRSGHYAGTIFHRVIAGFVIQGGGFTVKNEEKKTEAPISNESGNGLQNRRGTIGLARLEQPHSGTAQFYFNMADNYSLDPQPGRWGYAVFGHVVAGMEVLQKIADAPTGVSGPFEDAPLTPVVIEAMEEVKPPPAPAAK